MILAVFLPLPMQAQSNRIAARIDNSQRISLPGHIHPKALPQSDQGAVDPALIRLSVGIEAATDLVDDLRRALDAAS